MLSGSSANAFLESRALLGGHCSSLQLRLQPSPSPIAAGQTTPCIPHTGPCTRVDPSLISAVLWSTDGLTQTKGGFPSEASSVPQTHCSGGLLTPQEAQPTTSLSQHQESGAEGGTTPRAAAEGLQRHTEMPGCTSVDETVTGCVFCFVLHVQF